jgi:glycosyltransferase involved in cell wall biosynthesis
MFNNKKELSLLFVLNLLTKRGAEQQLLDLINALPADFHITVFVFAIETPEFSEFTDNKRIELFINKYSGRFNPLKVISLLHCLSKNRYDVAITEGLGASLFLGRICAFLKGVPRIYSTIHTFDSFHKLLKFNDEFFDIPNKILNLFFSRVKLKRAFRFLAVAEGLAQKIKSESRNYPVDVLHNGIPEKYIFNNVSAGYITKAASIIKKIDKHPTIIQVGVLDDNKNQLFTLKCVRELKEKIPDIRLLLVGEGKNQNELIRWSEINHLEDNVIFAGQLDRKDCFSLMRKSDVLVLTSHSEAFPLVLIEALASSLPVISFTLGGIPDIIQNNQTGFLIEKNDFCTFQKKLHQILTDKALNKKMGRNGKQRVLEYFTIERKIEKLFDIIQKDTKM